MSLLVMTLAGLLRSALDYISGREGKKRRRMPDDVSIRSGRDTQDKSQPCIGRSRATEQDSSEVRDFACVERRITAWQKQSKMVVLISFATQFCVELEHSLGIRMRQTSPWTTTVTTLSAIAVATIPTLCAIAVAVAATTTITITAPAKQRLVLNHTRHHVTRPCTKVWIHREC